MKPASKSFSLRLSLKLLTATSILFLVALLAVSVLSYREIVRESQKSSLNLLDANIREVESVLREVELSVENEAWLVRENSLDEEYLYHITERIVSESPYIVGSAIAFSRDHFKGRHYFSPYSYVERDTERIVSRQLGTDDYDYFSMGWFTEPFNTGKAGWCEPYVDLGGGDYRMTTYSWPLKDASGKVYAVITADVTLDWLSETVNDVQAYEHSLVILCSRQGSYLNVSESDSLAGETVYSYFQKNERNSSGVSEILKSMMAGEKEANVYVMDNHLCYVVYGSLHNGWKMSIHTEIRDVLGHIRNLNRFVILIAVLGLMLIFLVCYLLVKSQTGPLVIFSNSAKRIATGDFGSELPDIKSEDEIRQLRDSFEYMQNNLQNYIGELKQTTAANERLESELNIAERIQKAMLPVNFPQTDRIDLYALLRPAREVGGDLYDFKLNGNLLYFSVGDVSGKGVPASLYMALTRMACHLIHDQDLKSSVQKINSNLCENNSEFFFVTLLFGRLNLDTGELIYCNAGHNPFILVSPDGKAEFVRPRPNLALGLDSSFPYEVETVTLQKGGRIILYTDGVNEAEKKDGSQYGNDRLLQWAGSSSGLDSREASDGLLEDIRSFVDENPQNDDITIMTITYFK